jgi:hypothetical protein
MTDQSKPANADIFRESRRVNEIFKAAGLALDEARGNLARDETEGQSHRATIQADGGDLSSSFAPSQTIFYQIC